MPTVGLIVSVSGLQGSFLAEIPGLVSYLIGMVIRVIVAECLCLAPSARCQFLGGDSSFAQTSWIPARFYHQD